MAEFTTDDYVSAFSKLKIEAYHLQMLKANYNAPDRMLTATELAKAVGYENYGAVNLHYGKLGHQVGTLLGWEPLPKYKLEVLVDFKKPDQERQEWRWILKPNVAEAMERLGWVNRDVTECKYWLFQIMYDEIPDSWKLMVEAGVAAQQYPSGWINEIRNVTKLKELKFGDGIIAAFKNHRFAGYGTLISDFYRDGNSLDVHTNDGQVFEFKERFDCDWVIIPIKSGPNFVDCSDLRDSIDTRLIRGLCIKQIDEKTFSVIKSRLNEAGAIPMRAKKQNESLYTLDQCVNETGITKANLEHWVQAINRKGQAIIYGPPGTGKTFVAEHLTRHLVSGGDGFKEVIQFHPAYAYEDFVQGIRPRAREDGTLEYSVVPGRFYNFCQRASECQDICVLIIDEINRANLARVFGELMYLLEYRDKEILLAVDETPFKIPSNVRIIGTMNTADRSIALVDHALRRRFAFLKLQPDYEILKRFHQEKSTGFPVDKLIQVLQDLNRSINDPHYELGISYFLNPDLKDHMEDIWKMEIEPYLDEHFFDNRKSADKFCWENIKPAIGL
jgi:hypothetical protein